MFTNYFIASVCFPLPYSVREFYVFAKYVKVAHRDSCEKLSRERKIYFACFKCFTTIPGPYTATRHFREVHDIKTSNLEITPTCRCVKKIQF